MQGTDAQRLEAFRQTLLAIRRRLDLLVNLPPEKLAKQLIQNTARDLSKAD
jgi:isocitrate/isopropylmalate dehydrogenase